GKTTLFGMISGDVSPDAGEIRLGDKPITSLRPAARSRLGVGRTYQVPRPFEHMSVFENVLTGAVYGAQLGKAESRETALRVLELTGLLPVANRQAGRLTLLARKRLEVARALATRPSVLLLDEVAGGLTDPEVDELLAIVSTLRGQGLTVLWIEHVVHALLRSVDRLVCLAAGSLVADGAPAAVMADPTVRQVYLGADARTVAS
ncbi:MAG TPA: ATP-binding cassette domain-containing protein, partial [Pseudonocardiaceae bacterium]|nr:ATP-binding cassette domain-containing protein [Pseudonocardiaceae bacterium]